MEKYLKLATYQALLNETFQVKLDDGNLFPIKLTNALESKYSNDQFETFELEFSGAENLLLPQRLYHLNHPKIGDFTLFLVPVGQVKEGYIYQSVFNVKR